MANMLYNHPERRREYLCNGERNKEENFGGIFVEADC